VLRLDAAVGEAVAVEEIQNDEVLAYEFQGLPLRLARCGLREVLKQLAAVEFVAMNTASRVSKMSTKRTRLGVV
jgi:hypothetical protein